MEGAQKLLDEIINNGEILKKLNADLERENEILYNLAKEMNNERKKAAKLIED